MNRLKLNLRSGIVLLCLALLTAVECRLWFRYRGQALRSLAALQQKEQEQAWLAGQSPAPSEENEQAITRDLADAQKTLMALRSALQRGQDEEQAVPPARSIDLFFDLADCMEKTRALAARAGMTLKPDERFGFAAYANEGPEAELIPAVFRQWVAVRCLIGALIEARPHSLLAVRREHPLAATQRAGRNQPPTDTVPVTVATTRGSAEDFFDFDPSLTIRVPAQVDSDAFRLEFTGQTAVLRTFLNAMAACKLPVIVRSVEVEPADAGVPASDPAARAVEYGTPVPLVRHNLSQFGVVVEVVRLVPGPAEFTR